MTFNAVNELAAEVARLKDALAAEAADAARYRWLREKAPGEIVFDHTNDDCRFELYVPFDGEPIDDDQQAAARMDAAIDQQLLSSRDKVGG